LFESFVLRFEGAIARGERQVHIHPTAECRCRRATELVFLQAQVEFKEESGNGAKVFAEDRMLRIEHLVKSLNAFTIETVQERFFSSATLACMAKIEKARKTDVRLLDHDAMEVKSLKNVTSLPKP